ncbi:hypothetical protein [Streptomyces sp. NPDC086787]|uniref:hypothetical protein n=1 Tax=Streptomyces sp. NPDC086787 TaxID=3365759 RepID=UPI003825A8F6
MFTDQLEREVGLGAGISMTGGTLNLNGGTLVTGNVAAGQYSLGGGVYTDDSEGVGVPLLNVNSSSINANKVSGTGSVAGGLYNLNGTVTFTGGTVNNNVAPNAPAPAPAPAPGGVYTNTVIGAGGTCTGNFPTNCLFSPATVTGCVNRPQEHPRQHAAEPKGPTVRGGALPRPGSRFRDGRKRFGSGPPVAAEAGALFVSETPAHCRHRWSDP